MLTTKPMALPTTLLSAYDNMVGGLEVIVTKEGYMQVRIGGINAEVQLRGSINLLDGKAHHLACVLDAKAICAWLVVDGHMDDGGDIWRAVGVGFLNRCRWSAAATTQ